MKVERNKTCARSVALGLAVATCERTEDEHEANGSGPRRAFGAY